MAYTKINMPWLYDETTGDIVGIKDADGGETYLSHIGQGGGTGSGVLPGGMYLQWLQSLQYADENQPAYGAIRWHDAPATRQGEEAYYKIEPYFAHLAMYYALDVAPEHVGVMAQRWLNWWMRNINATTKTALIHYANTNGSVCVAALPDADPAVPADNEDATDSNAALFLLLLARYLSLFGAEGLSADWPSKAQVAYDGLLAVRDADQLTWAKSTYPMKYLMDNVEVWASLDAAWAIFHMVGDTIKRDDAIAWRAALGSAIRSTFWNVQSQTWSYAKDGAGTVHTSDLSRAYPDALCQIWPQIFGLDTGKNGFLALTAAYPQWQRASINAGTRTLDAQIALAAVMSGEVDAVRNWLVACVAPRRIGTSFTWPFTCADSALCAAVSRGLGIYGSVFRAGIGG